MSDRQGPGRSESAAGGDGSGTSAGVPGPRAAPGGVAEPGSGGPEAGRAAPAAPAPIAEKPLLAPGAGPFERHVFVCVSGGTCPAEGGEAVHAAMKDLAKQHCGAVRVRVNKSGCLGQCGHGPMVAVYPENVWYAGVRPEDVAELVATHLVGGLPVERLLFRGHHAGPNAIRKD